MISKNVKKFCYEDISLIKNYELAINDNKHIWDCHHRKETDEGLSRKQLIELGLYYGRPASELILLTHSEHMSLHCTGKSSWNKSSWNEEHKIEYINLLLAKNMRIYTLTNTKTGEIKNFIKKTNLAKYIKTNTSIVELAIIKNTPICKKTGENYMVECRDINIGMKFEDL